MFGLCVSAAQELEEVAQQVVAHCVSMKDPHCSEPQRFFHPAQRALYLVLSLAQHSGSGLQVAKQFVSMKDAHLALPQKFCFFHPAQLAPYFSLSGLQAVTGFAAAGSAHSQQAFLHLASMKGKYWLSLAQYFIVTANPLHWESYCSSLVSSEQEGVGAVGAAVGAVGAAVGRGVGGLVATHAVLFPFSAKPATQPWQLLAGSKLSVHTQASLVQEEE